jgi:hypothetical protein
VEAGASNEYGDKDITPLMNLLVPHGLSTHSCDANGNIDRNAELRLLTTDAEEYAGVKNWNYPSERVLITAGEY